MLSHRLLRTRPPLCTPPPFYGQMKYTARVVARCIEFGGKRGVLEAVFAALQTKLSTAPGYWIWNIDSTYSRVPLFCSTSDNCDFLPCLHPLRKISLLLPRVKGNYAKSAIGLMLTLDGFQKQIMDRLSSPVLDTLLQSLHNLYGYVSFGFGCRWWWEIAI